MKRRGELLARIAAQRDQIVELGTKLETPLALGDRALAAARFVRLHPILVVAVVVALVTRRVGVVGLAGISWRLWKRYRYLYAAGGKLASLLTDNPHSGRRKAVRREGDID